MTFKDSVPFFDKESPTIPLSSAASGGSPPVVSQPDDSQDQKPSAFASKSDGGLFEDVDYSALSDSELQEILVAASQAKKKKIDKIKSKTSVSDDTPPPPPPSPTGGIAKSNDGVLSSLVGGGGDKSPSTATASNRSSPSSILSKSDIEVARRFELYFADDFHLISAKTLPKALDNVATIAPVDWCDSFVTPFHISLACDLSLWTQLQASFIRLSTPEELHVWISAKIKTNSLAFLGSSCSGRPMIFHNLCCPMDCGTLVNPSIEFFALDRPSFDAPPIQIDVDDISSLLQEETLKHVPSFSAILEECVGKLDLPPDKDSTPCFFFDGSQFKKMNPVPSSEAKESDRFTYSNLCLIPPAFAGMMIKYMNPARVDSSFSFEDIAANLYELTLKHWWSHSPDMPLETKLKGMQIDFPFLSALEYMFCFLWVMTTRSQVELPRVVIPNIPKDTESAFMTLLDHRHRVFPELISSPDSSPNPSETTTTPPQDTSPPQVDCSFPSSNNPPRPTNGVRMIDDEGIEHFVSPEMFLISKCLREVGSQKKISNEDDITSPESKSMFRDMPQTAQKQLRLGVIDRSFTSLPTDLPDVVKKVWKSKNSATFFESFVAEVFDPMDNVCTILLGQCTVIQRLGLRWRSEASPGGFSPFSFDPYVIPGIDSSHTLDKNIRQQIHDASLCHLNEMKQSKDMQQLYLDHNLFFPRTEDEFEKQLRSY